MLTARQGRAADREGPPAQRRAALLLDRTERRRPDRMIRGMTRSSLHTV
jgi:hypothetical protein